MRYESIQQQKGLFTFYKQQQAEEDQIRRILKKRKKGKNKKQKKALQSIREDGSLSPTRLKDISLTQIGQSKQLNGYSKFLQNVISKQNSQLMLSHEQKNPSSFRMKTDHTQKYDNKDKDEVANFFVQRKLQTHKSSVSNIFKQREMKNNKKCQIGNSNFKIGSLHSKIQHSQRTSKHQQALKRKQEFVKDDKKPESRSFLEKLKFLQLNNKSNLISNRDSLYVQEKESTDLHSQNKKYFQQLISNFYKQSDEKNQTGYKMIKEALRFPNIVRTDKTLRFKTEEESPCEVRQKVMTPLKPFSNNRKQMKRKHSNQKYNEIIKSKDVSKLMNSQDGKLLNFIDLSRDYSKELVESEQRVKNKRLVRCRLGLQL